MSASEVPPLKRYALTPGQYYARDCARELMLLPKPAGCTWIFASILAFAFCYIVLGAFLGVLAAGLVGWTLDAFQSELSLNTLVGKMLIIPLVLLHQLTVLAILSPLFRPVFRYNEIEAMHKAFSAGPNGSFVLVPNILRGQIQCDIDIRLGGDCIEFSFSGKVINGTVLGIVSVFYCFSDIAQKNLKFVSPAAVATLVLLFLMRRQSKVRQIESFTGADISRIEKDHNLYRFKMRSRRLRLPLKYTVAIVPEFNDEFAHDLATAFPTKFNDAMAGSKNTSDSTLDSVPTH